MGLVTEEASASGEGGAGVCQGECQPRLPIEREWARIPRDTGRCADRIVQCTAVQCSVLRR